MTNQNNPPPIEVLRDGPIKASIWRNEGENGTYLTATFARTYTKDGEPRDTNGFQGRDLLVLSELARRAYRWTSRYWVENSSDSHEPE